MDPLMIGVIVVVVIGLAVAFSPDPFSSALRARIPWLQKKAANAVDSVEARTAAGQAAQAATVRFGRKSLYEIGQELAASEIELDRAAVEIEEDNAAIALARKNNDRESFDFWVAEVNRDTAYHKQLLASHNQIVEQLKTLEVSVDQQRDKEKEIEAQGRVMRSQARVADVTVGVNEAQAGLNNNGAAAHMDTAQKILDEKMAKAKAAQRAAEGLTPSERQEQKAEAYLKQVRAGAGVNADALWNQMAAADQNSSSTEKAPGA